MRPADDIIISVVIPAYNVENYITRTLNSLEEQNFRQFEIIIINDGSTDNTLEVINSFSSRTDMDLKIITQKNQGVSQARNAGLERSSGEYILFLDGDDHIDTDYLKIMHEKFAEKECDFLFCGYNKVYENGEQLSKYNDKYKYITGVHSGKDVLLKFLKEEIYLWIGATMYRKRVIIDNNIKFSKNFKYGEDQEFFVKVLYNSENVICVDRNMAYYVQRKNSVMQNTLNLNSLDVLAVYSKLKKYISSRNNEGNLIRMIDCYKIPKWILNLLTDWSIGRNEEQFRRLLKFKAVRSYLYNSIFLGFKHYRFIIKVYTLLLLPSVFYRKYDHQNYNKRFIK